MKIAIAQINPVVGDLAGNRQQIEQALTSAREQGAELLLTPELALSGYLPEDLLLRRDFTRQVNEELDTLSLQTDGITLVVGHPLREGRFLYNAASVIRDGKVQGVYRKFSLPNHTVFDEKRYFTSGSRACVFRLHGVRFGVNICADVWHPEAARAAADAGAQVLLVLNASPFHLDKQEERYRAVRDRIADTGMSVVYCNTVGGQDELVFDGGSFVMDRNGCLECQFPAFETGVHCVTLDGNRPIAGGKALALSTEAMVWKALVRGLTDYVEKNRFPGVLLGLSGGIDSAVTLALAVDALGADRVHAVMMPSGYTADISVEDARSMAHTLGVHYTELPIGELFDAYRHTLGSVFVGLPEDLTEENLQARIRGTLLMALSNKFGNLVVTTGNKSEMAVGYATLYGDMAGGFALLRDVPKTLVYRLSEYRNSLTPVIPRRIIDRPPSAELRADQRDQDSLPAYEILDDIIHRYVEKDESPQDIVAAGHDAAEVKRVIGMIDRSEYKRRQAPPGVRITPRAFGRDRRYPITQRYIP